MTHGAATRFVGRERELDELRRALTDAEAGQGRVVLLGGEPGIGKSRLADELVSIARDRGHVVAWGRVWEAVGAPPYWPWVQVLRPLIRGGTDDSLRELLGPGARDVAQILPELRERIAEIPSSIEADSDSARFQLFDSTATFLRNVGERRPLVVVLDDMHAADLPSIRLLRFVAGQVAGAHLLLMATYRDLELVHRSAIAVELEEITREPTTRALRWSRCACPTGSPRGACSRSPTRAPAPRAAR